MRASQDEVARLVRLTGLRWTRSTVALAEAGRKPISLDELVLLALCLCGGDAGELLAGDGDVRLANTVLSLAELRAVLSGDRPGSGVAVSRIQETQATVVGLRMKDDLAAVGLATPATGDAEAKAARRLGRTVEDVNTAAAQLWGRSLTQERDRRVAAGTTDSTSARTVQAMRGHITPQLLAELEPVLREV